MLNGQVLGNQRYVGPRISIMCKYNYVLVGPKSLTCRNNGHWESDDKAVPKCIRGKAELVVDSDEVTFSRRNYSFLDNDESICDASREEGSSDNTYTRTGVGQYQSVHPRSLIRELMCPLLFDKLSDSVSTLKPYNADA